MPNLLCLLGLNGQSNKIFDCQFFSSFKPAWATDQWVYIFSILVKILPSVEKTDPLGYHTLGSHVLRILY